MKSEIQGNLKLKSKQEFTDIIQNLFLTSNKGFALVGRRHYMRIEGGNYYLDLLFYHTRLHYYCVVVLKNSDFKSEYATKLNFYLSAVDNHFRCGTDKPSIGILLCQGKKLKVGYTFRDANELDLFLEMKPL